MTVLIVILVLCISYGRVGSVQSLIADAARVHLISRKAHQPSSEVHRLSSNPHRLSFLTYSASSPTYSAFSPAQLLPITCDCNRKVLAVDRSENAKVRTEIRYLSRRDEQWPKKYQIWKISAV